MGGYIIKNNVSLTCMTMINPYTGWFEIFKVTKYELDDGTGVNDDCIDKSSSRVSHLFNNKWINIHPRPCKFVFDNGYEFKWDFNTFINDFDIKPVLTTIKNLQANAPVEWLKQVILNMIVTKDISNKVLDYIDTWGETLAYTA